MCYDLSTCMSVGCLPCLEHLYLSLAIKALICYALACGQNVKYTHSNDAFNLFLVHTGTSPIYWVLS
jgi:hypothetical protein